MVRPNAKLMTISRSISIGGIGANRIRRIEMTPMTSARSRLRPKMLLSMGFGVRCAALLADGVVDVGDRAIAVVRDRRVQPRPLVELARQRHVLHHRNAVDERQALEAL